MKPKTKIIDVNDIEQRRGIIAGIREANRWRVQNMKSRVSCENRISAMCRIQCSKDFPGQLTEAQMKALNKQAQAMKQRIVTDKMIDGDEVVYFNSTAQMAMIPEFKHKEDHYLNIMVGLCKQLPASEFPDRIKGFNIRGMAKIIGECGDLSNYATISRLWKRLGLAVIDGRAQCRVKSDKAKAVQQGYVPRRRAELWNIADSMFKHQQGKVCDETGALLREFGPYAHVYNQQKQRWLAREASNKHADNHARRYMTKTLVLDLWRYWIDLHGISDDAHTIHESIQQLTARNSASARSLKPVTDISPAASEPAVPAADDCQPMQATA